MLAELPLAPVNDGEPCSSVAHLESKLKGIREALPEAGAENQPVHDRLDPLHRPGSIRRSPVEVHDVPVPARPNEPLSAKAGEDAMELAARGALLRRQQEDPRVLGKPEGVVHHLLDGHGQDHTVASGAVRLPQASKEHPQVVVDLGDGADGGPWVTAGGSLLDSNRRTQAVDALHARPVHSFQKLPGVGGKGFHVTALALGVKGVKGERGLPRAARAGDYYQASPRDVQVDMLQVMLTSTANRGDPIRNRVLEPEKYAGGSLYSVRRSGGIGAGWAHENHEKIFFCPWQVQATLGATADPDTG
jgi:hypothetical protein